MDRKGSEGNWLELDVDEAAQDADHLISPEERFPVAMARQ
jgi:arylsulfatase